MRTLRGVRRVSPFTVPMMIPDMGSGIVAMHLKAGGPNYSVVSACASSAHGIGEADCVLNVGVSGPGVVLRALQAAGDADFGTLAAMIRHHQFTLIRRGGLASAQAILA